MRAGVDLLHTLDPRRVHGDTLVGALAGVRRTSEAHGSCLRDAYRTTVIRLLDALPDKWGWEDGDVADARHTLLGPD